VAVPLRAQVPLRTIHAKLRSSSTSRAAKREVKQGHLFGWCMHASGRLGGNPTTTMISYLSTLLSSSTEGISAEMAPTYKGMALVFVDISFSEQVVAEYIPLKTCAFWSR
jgi:hypothetical protein